MNEPKQKPRELPLYFTPIYNLIIQTWLLSRIERSLVVLFASYQNNGCNWSRERLKKYCECGSYHLERAIKRLKFMHIIDVERGGWKSSKPARRENNRYFYNGDPFDWRVTKEVQERIIAETYSLKKEPRPFTHDGFSNEIGLEVSFTTTFPQYSLGRKGRRKKNGDKAPRRTEINARVSTNNVEDQKWLTKTRKILSDDLRFASLASEYYRYAENIELAQKEPDHGFSEHQLTYLERLHAIFAERRRSLRDEKEIEVLSKIEEWLRDGLPYSKLSLELTKLDRSQQNQSNQQEEK